MKIYLEVELDSVENFLDIVEYIDVNFVDHDGNYLGNDINRLDEHTTGKIVGYNIFTNLNGKLVNSLTGNEIDNEINL